MSHPLNVGQLKAILAKYDDNVVPVIYDEDSGNYHTITKENIEREEEVYFPDDFVKFPKKQQFLKISFL